MFVKEFVFMLRFVCLSMSWVTQKGIGDFLEIFEKAEKTVD